MKAKIKSQYTAPAIRVVELQPNAFLCASQRSIDWTYEDDFFIPQPGEGWGLPGYGDAINI